LRRRKAPAGTHANIVRMARDSGAARDVRPQEAVTLDIVAELFDLLFGDPNIADGIKALVARLQSTVLKAAMLNQRFFADRSHPARRFLDSISTVAIRWGKVVNADDPFYRKLSELVNKVQATYDGDMAVFDAANAELDAFLAEREKIEEQQDRELADAVHAREEEIRLTRAAQMRAQRTANQCIERCWGRRCRYRSRSSCAATGATWSREDLAAGEDSAPTERRPAHRRRADPGRNAEARPGRTQAACRRAARPAEEGSTPASTRSAPRPPSARHSWTPWPTCSFAALRCGKAKARPPRPSRRQAETPRPVRGRRCRSAMPPTAACSAGHLAARGRRSRRGKHAGPCRPAPRTPARARRLGRLHHRGTKPPRAPDLDQPSRTLFLFSNSAAACAISITPEALAVRLRNKTASIVLPDRPMFERAIHGAIRSLDKRA
jgi:hypothetical protein